MGESMIFNKGSYLYAPLGSWQDADGKVWVRAKTHTTLVANTPYKVTADEFGYLTCAVTTECANFMIGVPNAATSSGVYVDIQVGGYVAAMITPSLSVSAGHALYLNGEAVADKGADYTGSGTEFAICTTASSSSTTQAVILMNRVLNDRIVIDSTTNQTVGGLMQIGVGTSEFAVDGTEITNATAEMKFIDMRLNSSATSGTSRGMYIKLFLTGNAGGEALRAYTVNTSDTPADTCNGAHISLGFGTSTGNVTGLATAARFDLMVPNRALAGTTAVIMAEIWAGGASSTNSGVMSFLRMEVGGNATGITALTRQAGVVAFHFAAGCADTTNGIVDHGHTTNTAAGAIKIYIDGVGLQWITYGTGA